VVSGAWGARGNDCGPEPSLRTAPASSSYAFGSLRIPSGLSTPRAPQAPDTPGSVSCNLTSAGEICFLRVLATNFGVREDLAGPAPGRPRGRPFGAYASWCVVAVFASRVAALLVISVSDCISHPTNDSQHLNPGAWRAMGRHAQDSARCAPPFSPQKIGKDISKQLYQSAKATTAQSTTDAYAE